MTTAEPSRFEELRRLYRIEEAAKDVRSPIAPGETVRIALPVDAAKLVEAVKDIEVKYRLEVFSSSEQVNDRSYENLSLTFNPDQGVDPHRSTLGTQKLSQDEHYYGNTETIAKLGSIRDSYYDTYGFRKPTHAAATELSFLTSKFKRSLVRSRLSIIRGGHQQPSIPMWGWHKDEPVFENLRVNIHVTDSDAHRIQIMREDRLPMNAWDADMAEHRFEVGYGYSWDTNIPHRACAVGFPRHDRAALIYGVSPWFDYDAQSDSWAPNEFFGKKHPLQMLLDGDVL